MEDNVNPYERAQGTMAEDNNAPQQAQARVLTPAAARALAEAEARRQLQAEKEAELTKAREVNGRGGKDPVRYDDWEIKGIASDF